jgi:hypothetical protein
MKPHRPNRIGEKYIDIQLIASLLGGYLEKGFLKILLPVTDLVYVVLAPAINAPNILRLNSIHFASPLKNKRIPHSLHKEFNEGDFERGLRKYPNPFFFG